MLRRPGQRPTGLGALVGALRHPVHRAVGALAQPRDRRAGQVRDRSGRVTRIPQKPRWRARASTRRRRSAP